jgi:uncharacterized MAPEG superfamily protein
VSGRLDRALVDLVGGPAGGAVLFELACARLARAAREASEDERRFRSHPAGALRRLRVDVADALEAAGLAVELQAVVDGDAGDRAADLAGLLLDRAAALADARLNAP